MITNKKFNKGRNARKNNDYMGTYNKEPVSTYAPTAFKEIRADFGLDPVSHRTKDEEKLRKQQEKFLEKKICPICGAQKVYVKDTNVVVCPNPDCKGFEYKDKEGKVIYTDPSFNELDLHGETIASAIFEE